MAKATKTATTNKPAAKAAPVAKTRKIDTAVDIFKNHLAKRETMAKKDFRNLVVADISKTMGITNKGTLGMYFSWADQLVSERGAKQYNRTAPRKAKGANVTRDAKDENGQTEEERLNAAVAAVNKTIGAMRQKNAKKAETKVTAQKVTPKKIVAKKA